MSSSFSQIKIASKVWNVHFGERETRALCRHGSARERGTKGTSLSLSPSLSLFLSRTKKTKRAVFERDTREVAKFSKVFLLSSNDFESFLSFPQTTRSKTHLCSSSLSLCSNHTGHAPAKTARVWETRRYVHSFCIFLRVMRWCSRERVRRVQHRATLEEREKGLKIFEFSPPLCVSLSQFFPNIE